MLFKNLKLIFKDHLEISVIHYKLFNEIIQPIWLRNKKLVFNPFAFNCFHSTYLRLLFNNFQIFRFKNNITITYRS